MFDILAQTNPAVKIEEETDYIPGSVRNTGFYPCVLKYAYLDESQPNPQKNTLGGARNINLVFDIDGAEWTHKEYISSAKEKNQSITYTNDKGTFPLPGYAKMEALFKQFTGKGISAQDGEEKTLKIWDGKAETLQKRAVFTEMTKTPMILALVKVLEDKYGSPGETRNVTEIEKFLSPEGLTAPEMAKGMTEGTWGDTWLAGHPADFVKDKRKNKSTTAGAPTASKGAPAAGASLFNKPA